MEDPRSRPLDEAFAIAAERHTDRMAAIVMAARMIAPKQSSKTARSYARILAWFLNAGAACQRVPYHARTIARSPYVDCSERTVQRGVAAWRAVEVLRLHERRADNGSALPPHAELVWSSVSRLLAGQAAGSALPPSNAGVPGGWSSVSSPPGCDGVPSSAVRQRHDLSWSVPSDPAQPPSTYGGPSDMSPPLVTCHQGVVTCHHPLVTKLETSPPDSGPPGVRDVHLNGLWRNPREVLARAHAVSLTTETVTVVDDVSDARREASWQEIRSLADEAGTILCRLEFARIEVDGQVMLRAAAMLALLLFDRQWLLKSATATINAYRSPKPPVSRFRYFVSCLRRACFKAGVGQSEGEVSPEWFGRLMLPAEQAVLGYLPPEKPEPCAATAERDPLLAEMSMDERRAAAADLRRLMAEKCASARKPH